MNAFAFTDGLGFGEVIELVVPPMVVSETTYVYADDSATQRVILDAGVLRGAQFTWTPVALSTPEIVNYIAYSTIVDDGEAQVIAIAQERGLSVLTDDTKGLRLARSLGLAVATTLDLALAWASGKAEREVQAACRRLRIRARYDVPRDHPLASWYRRHVME